ncbi:MAG TPA: PIN domain-containing protein [bacterium]|nr:PIN domain-containing protein [bacterium]
MSVFVDASALYAVMDHDDSFHGRASIVWKGLLLAEERLITHNYVLLECAALFQNRLGMKAAKEFNDVIVPMLEIHWIDQRVHQAAAAALYISGRKSLSLVDCISFETMRNLGITTAFAFDRHFNELGFKTAAPKPGNR